MTPEPVSFEGYDCLRLEGDGSSLVVTVSAGPRILGLEVGEGNLMAVVPEEALELPDGRVHRLLGGHRLWVAPEVPSVTYEPDDVPCTATELADGLRVDAPPDGAGIGKALEIRRDDGSWVVDHEVRNGSGGEITLAPWALTQLRLGGEVTLPIGPRREGPTADRSLVLWPYTDLGDPRIRFGPGAVTIEALARGPRLKLGAAPSDARVAYRVGSVTFEKRIEIEPEAEYADRGAAVQVFVCDAFVELETLAPLRTLQPGAVATHRERWTIS